MKRFWWSCGLIVTACSPIPAPQPITAVADPCPIWGCGGNSPLMGPYRLDELDENGAQNDDGVRLLGMIQNGVPYHVDVVEDYLTAYDDAVQPHKLTGTALQNAELMLEYTAGGKLRQARIKIVHVSPKETSNLTFWLGPADRIETYELVYELLPDGGPPPGGLPPDLSGPLCKHAPTKDDTEGHDWPKPYEAILFTGDRYDAIHKKVTASSYAEATTWFNIACAGSAVAKLHLNRHTTPGTSTVSGYKTTLAQRQAMLKMYVGDFCGSGVAYTAQGTKLFWHNTQGWKSFATGGNQNSYESLWNENGAMCLDTHRLHNLSPIDFQAIIQGSTVGGSTVNGKCPKPSCETIIGFPEIPANAYLETQSAALP